MTSCKIGRDSGETAKQTETDQVIELPEGYLRFTILGWQSLWNGCRTIDEKAVVTPDLSPTVSEEAASEDVPK